MTKSVGNPNTTVFLNPQTLGHNNKVTNSARVDGNVSHAKKVLQFSILNLQA